MRAGYGAIRIHHLLTPHVMPDYGGQQHNVTRITESEPLVTFWMDAERPASISICKGAEYVGRKDRFGMSSEPIRVHEFRLSRLCVSTAAPVETCKPIRPGLGHLYEHESLKDIP